MEIEELDFRKEPQCHFRLLNGVIRKPERVQTLIATSEFGVLPYRLADGSCEYALKVTAGCAGGGQRTEPHRFPVACDTTYRAYLPVTIDPFFVGMCRGDVRIEASIEGSEVIVGRTSYRELDVEPAN